MKAYNQTFFDDYIEQLQQENLIKEAQREQEEMNHKSFIAAVQKLSSKNIYHFHYPNDTYTRIRNGTISNPEMRLEICNKCYGTGKAMWFQKCGKCKGWSFVKDIINKTPEKEMASRKIIIKRTESGEFKIIKQQVEKFI